MFIHRIKFPPLFSHPSEINLPYIIHFYPCSSIVIHLHIQCCIVTVYILKTSKKIGIFVSSFRSSYCNRAPAPLIREAPLRRLPPPFGHCQNGGGVSILARVVWGTYLEKNCLSSNGQFAWLWGGQNACQDGLGHLCSENWSSNGYLLLLRRVLRLARMLWGTYHHQNGDLTKLLKFVRK